MEFLVTVEDCLGHVGRRLVIPTLPSAWQARDIVFVPPEPGAHCSLTCDDLSWAAPISGQHDHALMGNVELHCGHVTRQMKSLVDTVFPDMMIRRKVHMSRERLAVGTSRLDLELRLTTTAGLKLPVSSR